jgi:hypothetical protein
MKLIEIFKTLINEETDGIISKYFCEIPNH